MCSFMTYYLNHYIHQTDTYQTDKERQTERHIGIEIQLVSHQILTYSETYRQSHKSQTKFPRDHGYCKLVKPWQRLNMLRDIWRNTNSERNSNHSSYREDKRMLHFRRIESPRRREICFFLSLSHVFRVLANKRR